MYLNAIILVVLVKLNFCFFLLDLNEMNLFFLNYLVPMFYKYIGA